MDPEEGRSEEKLLAEVANGNRNKDYSRSRSHPRDELQDFRTSLLCCGLDQSTNIRALGSWIVFLTLTVIVPLLTIFTVTCDSCDRVHRRPYNNVVQISQSVVAAVAFICLSRLVRKYGLRRFLFLDALCDESSRVSSSYKLELNSAFRLLAYFLLPCFLVDLAMKSWWYATESAGFHLVHHTNVAKSLMCAAEIISRLHRTAVFFLVCVLFRLTCHLQILRFQDFLLAFRNFDEGSAQVVSILRDHLRIKHQLRVISHRFRFFIVAELFCVTFSQFVILFLTTEPKSKINIFTAIDLALCSVVLMTGIVIVLQSATRITHKALGVKAVACRWHALATCNSEEAESPASSNHKKDHKDDDGVSSSSPDNSRDLVSTLPLFYFSPDSDGDSSDLDAEEGPHLMSLASFCRTQISSFQKRQALVKYLEHNNAAITVFGFVLDRSSLHMVFGVELSLALFTLGKTISISA